MIITLISPTGREIRIYERVLSRLEEFAEASGMLETGGILVGRFEGEVARPIISGCLGPPPDSVARSHFFERGTEGVDEYLRESFHDGSQYLGEWHSHPNGSPKMSGRDRVTMQGIALRATYEMPEPILMIIAGSATNGWQYGTWRAKRWLNPTQYRFSPDR